MLETSLKFHRSKTNSCLALSPVKLLSSPSPPQFLSAKSNFILPAALPEALQANVTPLSHALDVSYRVSYLQNVPNV